MKLKNSFLLFLFVIIFCSCDKKRVFDEYKSVGKSWKKDSIVTFNFNQIDTIKPFNLFVNIRNNDDYGFNNLFLIVAMQQPDGLVRKDTLQYEMANPDGTLMGEGFSDIKENKLFYKEKVRFAKAGNYKIRIQQAIRKTGKVEGVSDLDGITEVGFRIESIE
jgi:gliding motility-associated lipoprotein GldH